MKKKMLLIIGVMLFCTAVVQGQNAVSLDSISGFVAPNQIPVGQPITFPIRFEITTQPGDGLGGFSNAFDLYSPDGAIWAPTTHMWAMNAAATALRTNFGLGNFFIGVFNWNGNNHDTISFGGLDGQSPFGDVISFNSVIANITTAGFPLSDSGKTFCIDSCTNYPPTNDWSWAGGNTVYNPTFGTGPYAANYTPDQGYCFTLVIPPYLCGDVNNDGGITVADMVYLVQYMFNNGPAIPNPWIRADINCSRGVGPNVGDNTQLVSYLFNNGPAPCSNCP